MVSIAGLYLHEDPYSKDELSKLLGLSEADLESRILTENTRNLNDFKLRQRALHVFQGHLAIKFEFFPQLFLATRLLTLAEALRVWQFRDVCTGGSPTALRDLGNLMIDSHASCRDLYECSHPQLDQLVEMSRNHSLGARLTGAG